MVSYKRLFIYSMISFFATICFFYFKENRQGSKIERVLIKSNYINYDSIKKENKKNDSINNLFWIDFYRDYKRIFDSLNTNNLKLKNENKKIDNADFNKLIFYRDSIRAAENLYN